jgi:hypothetical protein
MDLALNAIARKVALSLSLLLASDRLATAQSGSLYFAGGTATDSSSGPLDTLGAGITYNSPRMGGFFETIGADAIFFRNLGVGTEYSFRKDQGPYAGIRYRPTFYDVNAVYHPISGVRRISPEIQAGLGRINVNLYDTPQFCLTAPQGCSAPNAEISSVNHFQLHFAGGVRFYIIKGLFLRPQLDMHWVRNFTEFGSSWVPEYTVALGYTYTLRRGR